MNYAVSIVVVFVVASVIWAVLSRRRYAPNLESLMSKLKRPETSTFSPGMDPPIENQRSKDDQLWLAIRGGQGLYRMFHNAGILVTLATRINEELGDDSTEQHDHISNMALKIRWATFRALIEWAYIKLSPGFPVPRFIARFAFDQYCELCSSVRAMIEFHHPSLVDQFDSVI